MLVELAKRILPVRVRDFLKTMLLMLRLAPDWLYDARRYVRHSATVHTGSQRKLEGRLLVLYHILEKGLSMPDRRSGFGREVAARLIWHMRAYVQLGYDCRTSQFQAALGVLFEYGEHLREARLSYPEVKVALDELMPLLHSESGGARMLTREETVRMAKGRFEELAASRRSVRHYAEAEVDEALIRRAVDISRKTPSVCNRQSWRVYSIADKDKIARVLAIQDGSRGFGHLAKRVLIVTTDLKTFEGPGERNQAYVDGGMFAMSLLYALHFLELGACPLNWAVRSRKDRLLRSVIDIPDNETIITLMSVGHLPETFSVACSTRRDLNELYCEVA
jgi:nitroreductase